MRILLLMDPFIAVPPQYYGGIERVVYDMACKYVEMGHEVTLIAGPNSKSPGRLIIYGVNSVSLSTAIDNKLLIEVAHILFKEIGSHDVIHNFGRLAWMFPIAWSKIRKVQTYMRYITPSNIKWLNKIKVRNIIYTAVSDAVVNTGIMAGGTWKTIYNCAPIEQYTFKSTTDANAPLVFLGRLERCKGAHSAIKVAKITKRKLIIAGNISTLKPEIEYFEKEIRPHIDEELISYVGTVDNLQKNKLLGSAAAMLLPVEWYEPFPIVLPEAYACGTPILAFPGGGVPEGIFTGITGYLSNNVEEMAEHVNQIPLLNRVICRQKAEELYSDTTIANNYLNIYNHKN